MSYDSEAALKDLELNTVVSIDGTNYAVKQPDSGLVIDADKLVVADPRVNGVTIDVRNVSTPIGTFSFKLLEDTANPNISSDIMTDDTFFLKKECLVHTGFLRAGTFDFADYKEIARTRITQVTKIRNGYSIVSKEATSLVDEEALNVNDSLQTAMSPATLSLDVVDGNQFEDSGIIKIGAEFIGYASKLANTLQGLTRGILGTVASSHAVGTNVFYVTEALTVNPIDLLLQVMLSKDGDGLNDATYDVFPNGLGISPNDIDIAKFESIRDEFFLGEQHDYRIFNNSSMLKYLEQTALISTNTRLVTVDGKISLALLDQVDFEADIPILDETSVIGTPRWVLSEEKIVNRIEISYDWNDATEKYESLAPFEDADSIALYGRKKPLRLKFKGVKSSLNGGVIVADRANRLLGRLATARGSVEINSHFNASSLNVGGNVQLVHRYLPQQGGTLGFSDRLEIMSRSIDLKTALVKTKVEFTSYTGIRIAFIAPSPRITAVTDQKTITVDDASCLKVGFVINLFKDGPLVLGDPTAGSYLPDAANVIESIVGNVVTFSTAWVSVLGVDIVLKMADYNLANEEQKARYAFVGENTGFFDDGSKVYQIIF